MNRTHTRILIAGAAILALAVTALGASYFTRASLQADNPPQAQQARVAHRYQPTQNMAYQPAQPVRPACDDHNIVGTVGGGLAGALVGNQFGKGSGKTIATVGGAAGGAYLGNAYIPTRGAACN